MRVRFALPAFSFALPILVAAAMIRREPNIPYQDEWEWADLSGALHRGALQWSQLWATHNEHRNFVPNLVFVALDRAIGWHVVVEELIGLAILVAGQVVLFRLIRRVAGGTRGALLFLACSLLLYTPAQFENFSMGYNLGWEICTAALIVVVDRLTARPQSIGSLLMALCAAAIAAFSSAQGLVAFAAGGIALAVAPRSRAALWTWGLALAAVVALYAAGYHGGSAGHVGLAVERWPALAAYALILLGIPFGFPNPSLCTIFGVLGVASFIVLAVRGVRAQGPAHCAPWIAFGCYALVCSAVIAVSRLGFGLDEATQSRYTQIAIWLFVAILGLVLTQPTPRIALAPAAAILVVFALGYAYAARNGNRAWHGLVVDHTIAAAMIARGDWSHSATLYPDRERLGRLIGEVCAVRDSPIRCP